MEIRFRKFAFISNAILLFWYFFAMVGVEFNDKYLVIGSVQDEWIFMVIPIVTFLMFLMTKRIGKVLHTMWLFMWIVTQFLSHEWYTIFGTGFMGSVEGKIEYFKNCIQFVNSNGRYIPDLYHIILHILIIISLIATIISNSDMNKIKGIRLLSMSKKK